MGRPKYLVHCYLENERTWQQNCIPYHKFNFMEIRKTEFPIVVQAYDNNSTDERFVAEQVVNNQSEIDLFTSRYAGKLIKARTLSDTELYRSAHAANHPHRRGSNSGIYILLFIIIALVVVGFATGWIQRNFNIQI